MPESTRQPSLSCWKPTGRSTRRTLFVITTDGMGSDRAANYHADTIGTEVICEAASETVSSFRTSPPMAASWKIESLRISEREADAMYGAILGDIIGSPYEFDQGDKW